MATRTRKPHVHTEQCLPAGTPIFTHADAEAKLHELGFVFVEATGSWHHADGTIGRLSSFPVCYQQGIASTAEARGYWLQPAAKRAPTTAELLARVPTLPATIPLVGETL
jgi:hypothetical protein